MSRHSHGLLAGVMLVCAGVWSTAYGATITLTPATKYQVVDGFGSHENISAWAVKQGPFYFTVDLEEVGFYDSVAMDMQIIRMSIPVMQASEGAPYSSVPFTHAIKMHQRGVDKFFGACWSPPGWMKSNGTEAHGGSLLSQYYDDYGRMVAEYARQFKEKVGIELYGLSLQNEPRFVEPYSSCVYNATTYRDMAAVAAPLIHAVSPSTKLLGPEDVLQAGGTSNTWVTNVLNNAAAGPLFGVYGVHCHSEIFESPSDNYDGWWNTVQNVADANNLALWMSETGDNFDTSWNTGVWLATTIANSFKRGNCRGWVWWTFTSTGDNLNGLILSGWYSQKYYQMAHFGRFVKADARRIESSSSASQLQEVAFQNTDNSVVVVIPNPSGSSTSVSLAGSGLPGQFRAYQSTAKTSMMQDIGLVSTGSNVAIPAWSITTLTSNTSTPIRPPVEARAAAERPRCRQAPGLNAVLVELEQASRVSLRLYSTRGELAARVEHRAAAGTSVVGWEHGRAAAGVYVARVSVEPLAGGTGADYVVPIRIR